MSYSQIKEVFMESLTFNIVKDQQPVYHRPFQAAYTMEDQENLEVLKQQGAIGNVNAAIVSKYLPNTLTLGAPSTVAQIAGGWGQERMEFTLIVRISFIRSSVEEVIRLVGYTDYVDMTMVSQRLDPNISLIIDSAHSSKSSITASSYDCHTNVHDEHERYVMDSYRVTNSNFVNETEASGAFHTLGIEQVTDMTNVIGQDAIVTNTAANNPSAYIAEYLNKAVATVAEVTEDLSMVGGHNHNDFATMSSNLYPGTLVQNNFLKFLERNLTNASVLEGSFYLGELFSLDNTLEPHRTVVVDSNKQASFESNVLGDNSLTSYIAFSLDSFLIGICSSLFLNTVRFTISNMTPDGHISVHVEYATSIKEDELLPSSPEVVAFTSRVQMEAFRVISNDGAVPIQIWCDFRLDDISSYRILVEGGVEEPFVIPTYASATYSPMVTDNQRDVEATAATLGELFEGVTRAIDP